MAASLLADGQPDSHRVPVDLGLELKVNDNLIPYYGVKQPRIVLALSGGGIRGLAQIGVLQVLERHGIPIDGIAGTSMGAVVGGLYAMGYTSTELMALAQHINWEDILQDAPKRDQLFLGQKAERAQYQLQLRLKGFSLELPSAYSAGQKLNFLLADLILNAPHHYENNFDLLPVQFRSVATDLLTGEKRVIRSGSIIDAMRASMAIPLLFTPISMNGGLLADGGLVQNIPVEEAQHLDADLVIAVDTSSKLRTAKQMRAPWEIADQVTTIMQQKQLDSQLAMADIVIKPHLEGISNTDAEDIDAILDAGIKATEQAVSKIDSFLTQYSGTTQTNSFPLQNIVFDGSHLKIVEDFLNPLKTKKSTDSSQLQWAGHQLLQTGWFQNVEMELDTSTQTLYCYLTETPIVKGIVFHGNLKFADTTLTKIMKTQIGKPVNLITGRQDLLALVDQYRQKGYFLARVDKVQLVDGMLHFYINEGVIQRIQIEGNLKTKPLILNRELGIKTGYPLRGQSLYQGLMNLYSTGFFESVRFDIFDVGNKHNLKIILEEQGNTLLRTGFRYDRERKSMGSFQILEDNVMGFGGKGSIKGVWGLRDESLAAYLRTDRLMDSYLTYKLGFNAESHDYTYYYQTADSGEYDQTRVFAYFSIGQQMKRLGTLSLKFQTERQFLKPITTNMIERDDYTIRSMTIRSEVDSRDRYPFPNTGNYHVLEYESALDFLGSKISYTQFSSRMEFYYPMAKRLVLHPRIAWGTADRTTPFIKQFRVGGLNSFIGLPENAFIGKRYMTLNTEFRYRAPWFKWWETYFSIRYDFGGVWDTYLKIEKEDFKEGFGLLLSVRTVLGPIVVGWGRYDQEKNTWYFSAGYALN